MGLWTVRGGNRLYGTVAVQGSRDGALTLLAASLMHPGTTVLERVPRVTDVERFLTILQHLDCRVCREGDRVTVDASKAAYRPISGALTDGLRASVLFLGAMIARFGEGTVPMPMCCCMGPRPLDLQLGVLSQLGAELVLDETSITCLPSKLMGGEVVLPYPGVDATRQAMLAACGTAGETVLRGCARDPEIGDLADYLARCGHTIRGMGSDTVHILPGRSTGTVYHRLPFDRSAAGTLLCAVAACGGKLTLHDIFSPHLQPILDGLAEMGCNIKIRRDGLTLTSRGELWSPSEPVITGPYPRFPSDSLPGLLAACLRADGVTVARERVTAGRAETLKLLRRFGGDVSLTEACGVVITGVGELYPADLTIPDVQTGAALLIAALQAPGESRLVDGGLLARVYEYPDAVLRLLGADISYFD